MRLSPSTALTPGPHPGSASPEPGIRLSPTHDARCLLLAAPSRIGLCQPGHAPPGLFPPLAQPVQPTWYSPPAGPIQHPAFPEGFFGLLPPPIAPRPSPGAPPLLCPQYRKWKCGLAGSPQVAVLLPGSPDADSGVPGEWLCWEGFRPKGRSGPSLWRFYREPCWSMAFWIWGGCGWLGCIGVCAQMILDPHVLICCSLAPFSRALG